MSDLRHDPIQRRWVIIATERGRRPHDFRSPAEARQTHFCPFCPGHEEATPPEIARISEGRNWKVRVVPNKFPALRIEGGLDRQGVGIFDKMNGIGAHEVVIETPDHNANLSDLPVDHLILVLKMCQERLRDLNRDGRFRYCLLFKNHGEAAGASIDHTHMQIIATPVTPRTVAIELDSCRDHFRLKERCLICDILTQEMEQKIRIVRANERFVVFAPYASRFPFETSIAPRFHQHDFLLTTEEDLRLLAVTLKDTLMRLNRSLLNPPYNFILHNAPNTGAGPLRPGYWQTLPFDYHWHIEIIPRVTKMAGFEWGTGFYINPTPPEEAAEYLREVEL
ncbi:MAG TPA: galactose-1-phosphate uridylyltransferase [Thermoanaerobaculia bacterium]|nr:galactose-1-phosphate uridylyltransferase [Thermoanaerobaculia bacterium]HUM29687.1 galactose-1-phosphate uridylyltransferase [Thermoanaerobaculia bacterium]HXK66988.1 galactose-1-phosphate uridylyltransferase [Thermoanaerobaculia bacterium]